MPTDANALDKSALDMHCLLLMYGPLLSHWVCFPYVPGQPNTQRWAFSAIDLPLYLSRQNSKNAPESLRRHGGLFRRSVSVHVLRRLETSEKRASFTAGDEREQPPNEQIPWQKLSRIHFGH